MEIAGYIASVFIGITLGLIGGGGSILTIPVLVYLFKIDTVLATAYSLFIVGTTSIIGSVTYFRQKLVDIKTAIVFGIPSIVAVYLTRAYLLPAIPDSIALTESWMLSKDLLLMTLFAIIMILASYSMIKKSKPVEEEEQQPQRFNYALILIEGMIVGGLTGLVGAGGGFLIIPALVVLSKLPMKKAVGTSLVIIAAKSVIGFLGEQNLALMDYSFLIKVSLFAIIGFVIGSLFNKRVDSNKLKPAFGWFVLVMGVYILINETLLK